MAYSGKYSQEHLVEASLVPYIVYQLGDTLGDQRSVSSDRGHIVLR